MESAEDDASSHFSDSVKDSCLSIPSLPLELITDILLMLPVKSLLQFRSVSKSWLSLISSPEFAKNHLSISANNKDYPHHRVLLTLMNTESSTRKYSLSNCSLSSLLINDRVTDSFDLDYPMNIFPDMYAYVVGSVNGLICLAIEKIHLFLWNPSIRKFKKLPDSGPTKRFGYRFIPIYAYGFGYDEFHDDYKVVTICGCYRNYTMYRLKVKIYSLKRDSWRVLSDFPVLKGIITHEIGKLVNGKLHWATYDGLDLQNTIFIDLTDEKWGRVEPPQCGGEGGRYLILEAMGSYLCVICYYLRTHADVWVMKEYGVKESWTKAYTIDKSKLISPAFPTLCLSNKSKVLLMGESTFMIYNPEDESVRYPEVATVHSFIAAHVYIESLVSPLVQNKASTCLVRVLPYTIFTYWSALLTVMLLRCLKVKADVPSPACP